MAKWGINWGRGRDSEGVTDGVPEDKNFRLRGRAVGMEPRTYSFRLGRRTAMAK